jgi:hypothetical protein
MSTNEKFRIWGNAIWFNLLWFAAVIGADAAILWPALACLLMLIAWATVYGRRLRTDMQMAVAGLLIAYTAEPIWLSAGTIVYAGQGDLGLPPAWITLLWVGFAISFNHCLEWLNKRFLLATFLGLAGSMSSITAGARIGALDMPQGWLDAVLLYSPAWAIITPALVWLSARFRTLASRNEPSATEARPTSCAD